MVSDFNRVCRSLLTGHMLLIIYKIIRKWGKVSGPRGAWDIEP